MILFQGKYVPKDISVAEPGHSLTAHLESLEKLPAIEDAEFAPPPDAKQLSKGIGISREEAQGLLVKSTPPHYPAALFGSRVSGTVRLRVNIGRDGHVNDLAVLSGPPLLRQAALDAVKDWTYRPYQLNGEAVEVVTSVELVFNLGQ